MLTIVALEKKHLADAARLVARRYEHLRESVPNLPDRYADVAVLHPLLEEILKAGPGAAARQDGELAGFLIPWATPSFRGSPTVFSPEWANGAEPAQSARIYEAMYTHLASRWVDEGYTHHIISLFAHDQAGHDALHWLGFGMRAADAVRDPAPPHAAGAAEGGAGVEVRRAAPEDVETVMAMEAALTHHLAASPTFLTGSQPWTRDECVDVLSDPDYALWLARRAGKAAGYLLSGPASDDASTIIRDAGTMSITGAYTYPEARGTGIATALLAHALAWAREAGYTRCAVDFEPMNPTARRFWLRYFKPVTYALSRYVV
jgi:GNAT superfamily N-acetyltransferase